MRAVLQRVREASVSVDAVVVGRIGRGLLVLLGIHRDDAAGDVEWMARKIAEVRIFADESGKMNLSVADAGGEVLVVSQFTLLGSLPKGRRPSFSDAAAPDVARQRVDEVVAALGASRLSVRTGQFGAMMQVSLVNDGPVTLILDTRSE